MSASESQVLREFELGRYRILEEIGRGGMGVVYKAHQKDLDRLVAVKLLLSAKLATPDEVDRLHSEAQAAARVSHPNIVRLFEIGSYNGQHFIAMELVEGESLASAFANRSLDLRQAADLVARVARAVHHLHEQGILHRDLKPSNILLDGSGRPMVTDFGLAEIIDRGPKALSEGGSLIGTPGYMAPELIRFSESGARPQSDVYSLGAVLYEAATGGPPFGDASPVDRLIHALEREPPRPRSVDRRVPVELETVILRCLDRVPERRYPSAEMLAVDLESWLSGGAIESTPASAWHRLRRWFRRHPGLAVRLVAFGVFFGITLVNVYATGIVDATFLAAVSLWLGLWAVGSAACEVLQQRHPGLLVRLGWATMDVVLFTLILTEGDGVASPLVLVYPLMVVTSAFWFRLSLVVFTTTAALLSYGLLAALGVSSRAVSSNRHMIVLAVVLLTGFVVWLQVRRAKYLSNYLVQRTQRSRR